METPVSILEAHLENMMSILEAKVAKMAATLANFQNFVHNEFAKLPTSIDLQINSWRENVQNQSYAITNMPKVFEKLHQSIVLPRSGNFCLLVNVQTGSDPIIRPQTSCRSDQPYDANASLKIEDCLQFLKPKIQDSAKKPSKSCEKQGSKSVEKYNQNPTVDDAHKMFKVIQLAK